MNRRCRHILFTSWLLVALTACGANPTFTPTAEPTSTSTVAPTNTAVVLPPTWTPQAELSLTASATRAPSATPTATLGPTPTETLTATDTLSPTTEAALTDKAEFVADVTVPDGSPFPAGTAFTKTWRIKNVGTATWTAGYALVFISGEQMGGPAERALPAAVKPEETVDISVDLTAPQRLAFYTGFWQLRNVAGELFGVGAGANEPLYVQIQVTGSAGGSATPAPPVSTAPAGTLRVTAATLSVLSQTVTAPCPYTFIFNGTFTSEGAGTATYKLEATSDIPGFVFDLPAPFDSRFTDAGPRTLAFAYTLEFRNSVSGQAWVHILSPNNLESTHLSFSLICQ